MNIHQITATMSMGDAISNEVLAMQQILKDMGYNSEIYAENIDSRLKGKIKNYREYREEREDILIHHFGIGSDINEYVKQIDIKTKILRYHNVTPYEFFKGYSTVTMQLCQRGREQLGVLSDCYNYCLADSEYNKEELVSLKYSNIEVMPILLALDDYKKEPEHKIIEQYKDGKTNIIFVGRISPNKKQEDIIRCFYYYKKYFDKDARLFIVGAYQGMERYYNQLKELVSSLGIRDVYFTGHIPFKEILAYYHVADLFLCMSEHEGFCVPLVESMLFRVPILAYNSCAIPDTLGRSGILINKKDYIKIAGMMQYILENSSFRERVIEAQMRRLESFDPMIVGNTFKNYIVKIIGVRG